MQDDNALVIEYDGGFGQSNRGRMIIDLNQFMEFQTISKIKKLLRVIDYSYDRDQAEKIRQYCEGFLSAAKGERRQLEIEINDAEKAVREHERLVKECRIVRDRYKRKSKGWEHHQKNLSMLSTQLSVRKDTLHERQAALSRLERLSVKYEKVLQAFNG